MAVKKRTVPKKASTQVTAKRSAGSSEPKVKVVTAKLQLLTVSFTLLCIIFMVVAYMRYI